MAKDTTTLEDVARRAGVSISTASRALNDNPNVNARTKQLVWKLAREMDYPFRRYMPSGPIGAEGCIALVVPRPQGRDTYLADPFLLELLAGIGEAAGDRGCDLVLSHAAPQAFDELEAAMQTSRADGVIFIGQSSLHDAFNRLSETEKRFAVWGAELPDQQYCSVGGDNLRGGRRATMRLGRLGRKRIVFLGETEAPEVFQRYKGYCEALDALGLPRDEALLVPAKFEVASAESCVDGLISRGADFDAIFAATDLVALGAVRALQRAGRVIPRDVSVIGFDNVAFARYATPTLSTVSQDTKTAGRLLVSKILDGAGASRPMSERIPTELIVRESCGD